MKTVAAYLLLQLGGNASPSAADITALLEAGGVEADAARAEKLVAELNGKDINEVSNQECLEILLQVYAIGGRAVVREALYLETMCAEEGHAARELAMVFGDWDSFQF